MNKDELYQKVIALISQKELDHACRVLLSHLNDLKIIVNSERYQSLTNGFIDREVTFEQTKGEKEKIETALSSLAKKVYKLGENKAPDASADSLLFFEEDPLITYSDSAKRKIAKKVNQFFDLFFNEERPQWQFLPLFFLFTSTQKLKIFAVVAVVGIISTVGIKYVYGAKNENIAIVEKPIEKNIGTLVNQKPSRDSLKELIEQPNVMEYSLNNTIKYQEAEIDSLNYIIQTKEAKIDSLSKLLVLSRDQINNIALPKEPENPGIDVTAIMKATNSLKEDLTKANGRLEKYEKLLASVGPNRTTTQQEIDKLWTTVFGIKSVIKDHKGQRPINLDLKESKEFYSLVNQFHQDMKNFEWHLKNEFFQPIDEMEKLSNSR